MGRMGTQALSQFCQRVGSSLQAGVDVRRIWDAEARRGSARQRDVMEAMRRQMAAGESVAQAFTAANGFFPALVLEMVDVGERTGRLDEVFLRLSDHYENLLKVRRGFLAGIAWPVIELALALTAIGFFIWLYGFLDLKNMYGEPLTVLGLYGTFGLIKYIGILLCIGALSAAPIVAVRQGWLDMGPFYRLLIQLPVIGPALKNMALSRLTWALALATDSDLDAQRAVELAVRSTQNSYYVSQLDRLRREVRLGRSLREAFQATERFPTDFLDALETGETAGRVSETMEVLANQYQDRARSQITLLAVGAGFGVLLAVFGLIIFFIFKMFFQLYAPLFDTLESM